MLLLSLSCVSDDDSLGRPQLQIGFNCFLVDQKTGEHVVVKNTLCVCHSVINRFDLKVCSLMAEWSKMSAYG